jgi:signal transduction histidine kinase
VSFLLKLPTLTIRSVQLNFLPKLQAIMRMNFLSKYTKKLIPVNIIESPLLLRKAKVLTYGHLLVLLTHLVTSFVTTFVTPTEESVPFMGVTLFILFLFYIFKKYGNFLISGNLLAGIWILFLAPMVPSTGGLYSDNLLWLILAPLISLLFANRLSGLTWLLLLEVFLYHLYKSEPADVTARIETIRKFNHEYYFISYTLLITVIFAVVTIFETGQKLIINMLSEQKAILEQQKAELERQKQEMARQAEELSKFEEKLLASNQELENFAYAASHDLKEPLRMIGMYTQLLKRRLRGKLDDNTEEFMFYITDGVSRMQRLLDDLLAYSRLTKQDHGDVKDVDLNDTVFIVVHNLTMAMKETSAAVLLNRLPALKASNTEMTQLFQNLIANSIKFRKKEENPIIQIMHSETTSQHTFMVIDNGIGIKKEYQERVFNLFERLHSRSEYEGSGIGLATCKKIINKLGGRIWATSTENVGTTFHFTIPKVQLN